MLNIECIFMEAAADLFQQHPLFSRLLVFLSETNFTKALFFAPFLLVVWFSHKRPSREKILVTIVSCALALATTWCFTSMWIRPRPISPQSGLEVVNSVFLPYFESKPNYLQWGCFPSDHAAYLCALGLGLASLRKSVGVLCLIVAVVGNGLTRVLVGLHYPSDIVFGALIGALIHITLFKLIRLQDCALIRKVPPWIDRTPILQVFLFLIVIEMSVMFRDIRFLDNLFFGQ